MEQSERLHCLEDEKNISSFYPFEDDGLHGSSPNMMRPMENEMDSEGKILLKRHLNRVRTAQRRAVETFEERELRLRKNRLRNRVKRASETLEQRAERNKKNMERNRMRRLKGKSSDLSMLCVSTPEDSPMQTDHIAPSVDNLHTD